MSSDRGQASSGLSAATLLIASASSLAAALVVSKIWGGGTLIGAAVTPVLVALVSEALRRPAQAVTTVRQTRSAPYDPVAEGRRGLHEGDLDTARRSRPGEDPQRTVHRSAAAPRRSRARLLALAVATGLAAFLIAGVVLTGSELVFGNSAVSSSSKRTTYFGGESKKTSTTDEKTTTTETTPTTTTPTDSTTTETAPSDTTGTDTTTTPQPGTAPAAPPPEQTAPSASPPPTPPLPAPSTTPQGGGAPAPAP